MGTAVTYCSAVRTKLVGSDLLQLPHARTRVGLRVHAFLQTTVSEGLGMRRWCAVVKGRMSGDVEVPLLRHGH